MTDEQLHIPKLDQLMSTCNICKERIDERFHCTVCVAFDLCAKCYSTAGHDHQMQRLRFGDEAAGGEQKQINLQESRRLDIQRCVAGLKHACQSIDTNCHRLFMCQKLKLMVSHAKECKTRCCKLCKQVLKMIFIHERNCKEIECPVPFCNKWKLKQQQIRKSRIAASAPSGVEIPQSMPSPGTPSAMPQLLASLESLNLHNQGQHQLAHSCNICKENIEARYHCTVCVAFDLCEKCHSTAGHVHEMQRLGFKEGAEVGGEGEQKRINLAKSSRLAVHRVLEHACQCREANCSVPGCQKLKKVILHAKANNCESPESCIICKHIFAVTWDHEEHCQSTLCPVILCFKYKFKPEHWPMLFVQILKHRVAANPVGTPQGTSNTGPSSVSTMPTHQRVKLLDVLKRRLAANLVGMPQGMSNTGPSSFSTMPAHQRVRLIDVLIRRVAASNAVGMPLGTSNTGTLSVFTKPTHQQKTRLIEVLKRRVAASAVGMSQGTSNIGTSSILTKPTHQQQMRLIEFLKRRVAASAANAVGTPQGTVNTGPSPVVQHRSNAQVLEHLLKSLASLKL